MSVFYIILFTLLIYSIIGTISFIITKENETVAIAFGLGIVGLTLVGMAELIRRIRNKFMYHIGKRSIFEEEDTGKKYKCKVKDASDVEWMLGFKIIKRYAAKSEWADIPDFSKEFIENSKINCDNCKYNNTNQCKDYNPRCKHNDWGTVLEFDKFEKK